MPQKLIYIGVPFSVEEYNRVKCVSDTEEMALNRYVRRVFMSVFTGNKEKQGEIKRNKISSVCDL